MGALAVVIFAVVFALLVYEVASVEARLPPARVGRVVVVEAHVLRVVRGGCVVVAVAVSSGGGSWSMP